MVLRGLISKECHAALVLVPSMHLTVKTLHRLAAAHICLKNLWEAAKCLRNCYLESQLQSETNTFVKPKVLHQLFLVNNFVFALSPSPALSSLCISEPGLDLEPNSIQAQRLLQAVDSALNDEQIEARGGFDLVFLDVSTACSVCFWRRGWNLF